MNVFINSSVSTNKPVNVTNISAIEKSWYSYINDGLNQLPPVPTIKFTLEDGDIFEWYFTTEGQRNTDYAMLMSQMQPVGTGGGSTGPATWGTITGNIDSQVDLNNTFARSSIKGWAGEDLPSGIVVVVNIDGLIYKYDPLNISNAGKTVGITKNAALMGEEVTATIAGNIHIEVGSGWIAGVSYFIGTSGSLTATPPVEGISKKIATGLAPDTILVNDYPEIVKPILILS